MQPKIIKLPHGAILLYRRREINKAAYMQLYFKVGAANSAYQPGILHFGEHLRCIKTPHLTEEETAQLKDKIDMGFNAGTNFSYLIFYLYNAISKFKESLDIMTDCMLLNEVDNATFERERKVICNEIERSLDNDDQQLWLELAKIENKNKAYYADVIGTKEDVTSLTQPQVQQHISGLLNTHNLIIGVTGNLSLFKAKRWVKKYVIKKLNHQTPTILPDNYLYDFNDAGAIKIIPKDKATTAVLLHIPLEFNGKFYGLKERMMFSNYILPLFNGRDGLINKKLRRENGLIYAHRVRMTTTKNKGFLSIYYKTNHETVKKSLDLVASAFQELHLTKNKMKELKQIKKIQYDKRFVKSINGTCEDLIDEYIKYGKFLSGHIYDHAYKSIRLHKVNQLIERLFSDNRLFGAFYGNATPNEIYSCEELQAKFFPKKYPSTPSQVQMDTQNLTNSTVTTASAPTIEPNGNNQVPNPEDETAHDKPTNQQLTADEKTNKTTQVKKPRVSHPKKN